ncbi:MAG: alpha/beta fold hydrolase [Curvibacter sp.]|nr:alpha/beta fold hydrolase [Curvibacter sp.]
MHRHEELLVDTARLALRVYEPAGPARANLVLGAAMGVRQDYYGAFAQWLAEQGYRVTSFDYRGMGESRSAGLRQGLRGFKADLLDWAHDYEAVVAHAAAAAPGLPLYLLGHSLGAQLPGLFRQPERISGLLSLASGSGYWRENAPQLKRTVPYFWWVLVPLATRLFGYFPGRRLRKVGDLPAGVILQWRRWCLNPRYSAGAEGQAADQRYAQVRFPVLALSIADDELMTLQGTRSLMGLYANAPRRIEVVRPAEVQARRIGHFGWFRESFRATLWPRTIAGLNALAGLHGSGVTESTA